tara:strand:+ start:13 stop:534 length:522 start_codon:yes stop_codon:yes gene_type:complete
MIRPYLILIALTLTGLTLYIVGNTVQDNSPVEIQEEVEISTRDTIPTIDSVQDLLNALIFVESRGIENAVGDKHLGKPSVGVLQIRPIMVAEINRILRKQKVEKRFKLKDRFSREKSIEMFMIWKNYYHRDNNFETIARNWNGGPNGFRNKRTKKYWYKVKRKLDEYKGHRRV